MPTMISQRVHWLWAGGRSIAAGLLQWLLVLSMGSCLFACFYPQIDFGLFTTSLRDEDIVAGLWVLMVMSFFSSSTAFFLLAAALWYLRVKAAVLGIRIRWGGLLVVVTACILITVFDFRIAPSGSVTANLLWPLDASWPWIVAAYVAIPWTNRKYLGTALPLAHASAPPAV